MFGCKHDWKILDKTILPSKLEIMRQPGPGIKGSAFPLNFGELATTTLVVTCTCTKCGKLTTIRETN